MKLLQGQQLYISKHIHGQLLNEHIADPPPAPPITRLAPCVNTVSVGGVLLDTGLLAVHFRPPQDLGITTEKIGLGSYLFHDVPDKLPNGYFTSLGISTQGTLDEHLYSFYDLATIHYARIYEVLILKLKHRYTGEFIAQGFLREGENNTSYQGDTYSIELESYMGPFGAGIAVAWQQDMSRTYSWAGVHGPILTTVTAHRFVGAIPVILTFQGEDEPP